MQFSLKRWAAVTSRWSSQQDVDLIKIFKVAKKLLLDSWSNYHTFFHPFSGRTLSSQAKHLISLGGLLDDQLWHYVKVERHSSHLNLTVDKLTERVQIPAEFTHAEQVCWREQKRSDQQLPELHKKETSLSKITLFSCVKSFHAAEGGISWRSNFPETCYLHEELPRLPWKPVIQQSQPHRISKEKGSQSYCLGKWIKPLPLCFFHQNLHRHQQV